MRKGTPAAGVAGILPRIVLDEEFVDSVDDVCVVARGLPTVELTAGGAFGDSSLIGEGLRPAALLRGPGEDA